MNKENLKKLLDTINNQLINYEDYNGNQEVDKSLQALQDEIEMFIEDN